jgi:hypothetical protein
VRQLIGVSLLAVALVGSLVGTYLVYFGETEEKSSDPAGVPVYVATVDDLTKVTWQTQEKTITLERRTDERGPYMWVTTTTRTEKVPDVPPVIDPDTDDTEVPPPPPPPPPIVTETSTAFVGNEQADDLWKDFAPFHADRKLTPGADQDFGFAEPYGTVTVDRKAGPVELKLGKPTYGERARYLQVGTDVFLLDKKAITRVEGAETTLPERRLHPFTLDKVQKVDVSWNGKQRSWAQQNAADKIKAYWADPTTPDTKDEGASTWVPATVRLGAQEYVTALPDGATPVLTLAWTGDGNTWNAEVFSVGQPAEHYARTSFNRGVVKLTASQAEDIIADLATVMGEPAATPAP